jgi:hypothetical protein
MRSYQVLMATYMLWFVALLCVHWLAACVVLSSDDDWMDGMAD